MSNKLWFTVLFWSVAITVFVVLATSISLVTAGYQFDWQTKRLTRTGFLFLSGEPRVAQVTVNGQVVANRLPLRLTSILPGEYDVLVEKDGYTAWRKRFHIEPGEARSESDILLFLAKPEVAEATDPELIEKVKANTDPSPLINGREIRFNNRLVTRVSGELLYAALAPNRRHVFFQVGREIRVIEIDGTNELLLFTLDGTNASQLVVLADANELALLDGPVVKRLRIR